MDVFLSRDVHSTLRHWTCHQIVRCADEERLVRRHGQKCVGYTMLCVGDLSPLGMTSFDVSATSPYNGFIRNSRHILACVLWQCRETVSKSLSTHSSACVCTLNFTPKVAECRHHKSQIQIQHFHPLQLMQARSNSTS